MRYDFVLSLECSAGYFGKSCNNSCGHCVNSSMCDHVTGVCFGGCGPGYKEPTCDSGNTSYNMIYKNNIIVKLYHYLNFMYTKQHFFFFLDFFFNRVVKKPVNPVFWKLYFRM